MRRIGLALVAAGAITAAGGATAQAAQLNGCTGSGRALIPAPGHAGWNVDGSGRCPPQTTPTAPFTAREPTPGRFSRSGTSDSPGICTGSLRGTNLKLS